MLDAIVNEVTPRNRALAERSISATAGALFGIAVASSIGLLAGRMPFSLDLAMLTLYASLIPLSIAGFMVRYTRKMPRLPMLATLYFTVLFVAAVFFGEAMFGTGTIAIGGTEIFLPKLVGFRVMGAAALAGVVFRAIPAEGFVGDVEVKQTAENRIDWEARHNEAVRRLAMTNVDIRRQQNVESMELERFEQRLRAEANEAVLKCGETSDSEQGVLIESVAAA